MVEEKDTQIRSAVPQKEFVSFMVHKMAKNQKERFQNFCDAKGFNYAPAITFLLEFYEAFKKEKEKVV
jgi:hypothetical protein